MSRGSMAYQVSRNGQRYGPYTMDELRRYLASGNLLSTDLVQTDGVGEWVPLMAIVLPEPPLVGATPFGAATADFPSGMSRIYEPAPNLHWALLLLLTIVTFGSFTVVWYILLASWVKRIAPEGTVWVLYYACAGLLFCQIVGRFLSHPLALWYSLAAILSVVFQLVTRFKMRTLLEDRYNRAEPLGLVLSGVMTFFFGEVYFQYHLNRIHRYKQQAAFGL